MLEGLAATTHPDYYTRLETICQEASSRDLSMRTDVMEERYVVNNARFDLGEDPDSVSVLQLGPRFRVIIPKNAQPLTVP